MDHFRAVTNVVLASRYQQQHVHSPDQNAVQWLNYLHGDDPTPSEFVRTLKCSVDERW